MTRVSIDNIFPIGLLEAPAMVNRYGDISFAFKYQGPELFTLSRESLVTLNNIFDSGLNFLDEGYVLHKQDVFLESTFNTQVPENASFLTSAYYDHFQNKRYFKAHSYLYITKIKGIGLHRTYSTTRSFMNGQKPNIQPNPTQIRDVVFSYVNHLKGNGIQLEPIVSDLLCAKLFDGYLSAFEDNVLNDLEFSNEGIIVGNNKRLGILSLNSDESLPGTVPPYHANEDFSKKGNDNILYSDLLYALGPGVKGNHIVNSMMFLDGQKFWTAELEKRSKALFALSSWSKANGRMLEDNDAFIEATYKGEGRKVVRSHVNVMFWADSREEFKTLQQEYKSKFISLGITPHIANYLDQKNIYLSCFPGNGGTMPFEETFITHSPVACSLFSKESVIDRSQGQPATHGLMYTDRASNIPSFRDSWKIPYETKAINSRNIVTIGESGGGKSSTVIELLRQFLEMGFDITAIDIGRSFEIFCKTYNGNYLIYEEGMSLGINPFHIEDGVLSVSRLEYLASFIPILWDSTKEFSGENISALEKLLLAYYKAEKNELVSYTIGIDGTKSDIRSFYSFIAGNRQLVADISKGKDEFFDIESFLLSMEKYVDGKFDNLFVASGEKLVDPEKNLTCWELDNIKDHPTLFPIFSMLITHMTTEVMWKKRSSEKIFWFDEAWKVLEKPGMASLLKYLYKTVRKFDGGVGINIQTIGDLAVPGNASIEETILGNSPVKLLMKHKEELVNAVVEKLQLGEHGRALLRSINSDLKGKFPYTEHLNIIGSDMKVMRMMVSPYQRVNFMSEFADKAKFFGLLEESGNIEEAYRLFVEHKKWITA